MKSWISFLFPNDEYKEKRLLYFYAESAIVLFLASIVLLISNRYIPFFQFDLEKALLLLIALFFLYISTRYTFSGIEFSEISSKTTYKRALKEIATKVSIFFILMFFITLIQLTTGVQQWLTSIAFLLIVSIIWLLASYISLKLSYKRNKELM